MKRFSFSGPSTEGECWPEACELDDVDQAIANNADLSWPDVLRRIEEFPSRSMGAGKPVDGQSAKNRCRMFNIIFQTQQPVWKSMGKIKSLQSKIKSLRESLETVEKEFVDMQTSLPENFEFTLIHHTEHYTMAHNNRNMEYFKDEFEKKIENHEGELAKEKDELEKLLARKDLQQPGPVGDLPVHGFFLLCIHKAFASNADAMDSLFSDAQILGAQYSNDLDPWRFKLGA